VGSIDLLHLGPRNASSALRSVELLCKALNERLAELRLNGTAPPPSLAQYDILDTIKDPTSLLRVAGDKDEIRNLAKLISNGTTDAVIKKNLSALLGSINSKSTEAGGDAGALRASLSAGYDKILASIPNFNDDALSDQFISDAPRVSALGDNTVVASGASKESPGTEIKGDGTADFGVAGDAAFANMDKYVSFGSVFMRMVADPIRASGQYDEVQVIFYPFNKYAGAVHDLPISCFPMERGRFEEAIRKAAKETPELSCRAIIRLMKDRFIGFTPARAYLMAGFYNQSLANDGTAETEDINQQVLVGTAEKIKGTVNFQLTLEQRLAKVGIPEMTMKMPQVEVAVDASKMLDTNGKPITDGRGNTKTILKMHVYDAAMDPHGTFTEIMNSVKENELGMIQVPVADFNAARKADLSVTDAKEKSNVAAFIRAGLGTGVLEAITIKTQQPVAGNPSLDELVAAVEAGTVFLRVAGSFEEVKRLVSTGMPTLTYGSSTSAITNATLTTGGGAGLANVMLQRAFTSPGEVSAENLNTGVPMQILPAQLSISTMGCPLFNPMQRFFIDFGTGTSLDSVYFVTAVDTTIGKDGYKTDLKMSYGQGFATYVSINKQLAMMTTNFEAATPGAATESPVEPAAVEPPPPETDSDLRARLTNELVGLYAEKDKLTAAGRFRAVSIESFLKAKVIAVGKQEEETVKKKAAAATPAQVQAAIAKATAKVEEERVQLAEATQALRTAAGNATKLAEFTTANKEFTDAVMALNNLGLAP